MTDVQTDGTSVFFLTRILAQAKGWQEEGHVHGTPQRQPIMKVLSWALLSCLRLPTTEIPIPKTIVRAYGRPAERAAVHVMAVLAGL